MKNPISFSHRSIALTIGGLIVAGVFTLVNADSARAPIRFAQAKPVIKPQTVEDQIDELVKAVEEVADSYTQSWQKKNAPATVQVSGLYKNVMVEETRQVLQEMLKQPLSEQRLERLKTSLKDFVPEKYQYFMLNKASSDTKVAEIEDVEYTSQRVLSLWDKEGKDITSQLWELELSRKLGIFIASDLSKAQRDALKSDVVDLASFVNAEFVKRYPNVSKDALKKYEKTNLAQSLLSIDDPTSPVKQRLDKSKWASLTATLFKELEEQNQLHPNTAPGDVETVYSILWLTILGQSVADTEKPKHGLEGKKVFGYLRSIRDFSGRARNSFTLNSPFTQQGWAEKEAAGWLLKFGSEVSPN